MGASGETWPINSRLARQMSPWPIPGTKPYCAAALRTRAPRFWRRNFIGSKRSRKAHFNRQSEPSAKLLARAASCDVPPRDRQIRLAGYALRKAPVSTILDPIEISAMLLECPGQRCLMFSFDLMIVGSELQNIILDRLQRLGFGPQEVVLLASHTHNVPATDL